MPGSYPPAAAATGYFVGYNLQGWAGTMTATPSVLTIKSGNQAAYWRAYKACTIYQMTVTAITTNSTATTLSVQPWGNASGGATAAALGSGGANVNIPSTGGPFVTHAYSQSIALSASGYVGIYASASPTSALWINVCLWVTQAGI